MCRPDRFHPLFLATPILLVATACDDDDDEGEGRGSRTSGARIAPRRADG